MTTLNGHHIPGAKIRERAVRSIANLVRLLPHAIAIQVFDNEATVPESEPLRPQTLVAKIDGAPLRWPKDDDLASVPR